MKHITLWTLSLFLTLAGTAYAGEMKIIELTDGSVVTGEVLSLTNGTYTIQTETMGTLSVPDGKIKAIRCKGAGSGASSEPAAANAGEIQSLTTKMMADQNIMSMIESLKDDPEFAAILQDPAIMNAIQNNDIAALTSNPKFMKIMNNATVQNIQKKVTK